VTDTPFKVALKPETELGFVQSRGMRNGPTGSRKRTSDSLEPFAGHLAAKPRCGSTERCNTAPDHGASLGIALAQKPGLDSPDAPGGRSGPTQ